MAKQLKLRRGTTAQHSTFTGASGEITVDTDKKTLVVHDGVTAGGRALPQVDASGNLGIGTSSPADRLDARFATGSGNFRLGVTASNNIKAYNTAGDLYVVTSDAASDVGLDSQRNVLFKTANTERARIDSSGNLQVGMTSGSRKLSLQGVFGAYHTAGTNDNQFLMYNDGVVSGLSATYGSTGAYTPIVFYTSDTARMRIDTSGNVGIGTSAPDAKLVISGYTGGSYNTAINYGGQYNFIVQGTSGYTMFRKSDGTEMARIDSSGRLLVNSTTYAFNSSQIMNVGAGAIGVEGTASTSVYSLYIQNASGVGAASPMIRFSTSNGVSGSISSTGTTTTYATSSDYRLKENILPMQGALDTVAQLKPVTYTWKDGGIAGQGFIAHELQAVVPDAVVGEKDATEIQQYEISPAVPATYDEEGNELTPAVEAVMGEREVPVYQGIDTSFLVATLTAAIQEQQALIIDLTARLETLEAKGGV